MERLFEYYTHISILQNKIIFLSLILITVERLFEYYTQKLLKVSIFEISNLNNTFLFFKITFLFNFNDRGMLFLNITLESSAFYWNFNKLTMFAICCITKKDSKQ